jgi:nucleoid DNA-binding protein
MVKKEFERKTGTHVVLKVEDIERALDDKQKVEFAKLTSFIAGYRKARGKEAQPEYLVVNKDEPYTFMVEEAIEQGERLKAGGSDFK